MFRRRMIVSAAVVVAMLALAAPALAGGWAVVTLDSLPREVHAGQIFQLGFMVRQHGKTPTNQDLDGKPLKPLLTATKGDETISVVARQDGVVGHYVADVTFPSEGQWSWQIELPTFYVQNNSNNPEGNAAIFAPLAVLPASAPAPVAQAPAVQAAPVPAPAPEPAATFLGLSSSMLRWAGVILLLAALAVGLYTQRGVVGRRRVAKSQG